MESKLERLIHLLRSIAARADGMTAGGHGLGSYAAVGRMFNDYLRQARQLVGGDFIGTLDEMEIPAHEDDAAAFLGELALRAWQIAEELEFALAEQEGPEGDEEWEDAADALVRLQEAGVDVDDLVANLTASGGPFKLSRRRVDQICKLAEAGIDVENLVADFNFLPGPRRHDRHARLVERHRHPRHRHPASFTVRWGPDGGPRPQMVIRSDRDQVELHDEETRRTASSRDSKTWQMEILSRVEKGEITPEEAADLLKTRHEDSGDEV